jgi:hypothetical protein
MGTVDHRPGPIQRTRSMQFGQQRLVQTLPDTGLVPITQPPPTRHPRAEAQLLRQELPRNPGVEHEQDPGQDLPVIQTLAARVIGTARHDRQQRLDPRPQPIRHHPRRLLTLPHMKINNRRSAVFQDHSVRSSKGLPHGLKVRGDAARLLVTVVPAGAEYCLVPRDESDGDPAKFGLEIHGDAPRG